MVYVQLADLICTALKSAPVVGMGRRQQNSFKNKIRCIHRVAAMPVSLPCKVGYVRFGRHLVLSVYFL